MSDTMLLGVLRMPPDCWTNDPIDIMQRHCRYVQAADEIERLQCEVKDWKEEAARLFEKYEAI